MQKEIKVKTPVRSDFMSVVTSIHLQAEFVRFAIWYGTPRQFRDMETQKKFAESIGVCEDTLTDWKRHPQFNTLVYKTLKEWIRERVPDVIGGLYFKASSEKASASDVRMFLSLSETEISKINNKK